MKIMKAIIAMLALYSTPALADLNAKCDGRSINGDKYSIRIDTNYGVEVNGERVSSMYSVDRNVHYYKLNIDRDLVDLIYFKETSQGYLTLSNGEEIQLSCLTGW